MNSNNLKQRFKFATKYFLVHLLVTLLIAIAVGVLVFMVWYPQPYRDMTGGLGLYKLILIIDVICGPLLTLILATPKKKHREMLLDISLIACIQLAALGYGLYSVAVARPVAVAFEYNRFRLVNYANTDQQHLNKALPQYQSIPWFGIQTVGLKDTESDEERNINMTRYLKTGSEMGMWPEYWVDYATVKQQVWAEGTPLPSLTDLSETERKKIEQILADSGKEIWQLRTLIMLTPRSDNWLAFVDKAGNIVGFSEQGAK